MDAGVILVINYIRLNGDAPDHDNLGPVIFTEFPS